MGLEANAIRFLLDAKARGAPFDRVATIGRQSLHVDADTLGGILNSYGYGLSPQATSQILAEADGFCEPLVRLLGASEVCSIDVSRYQGASFLHDMNDPLPPRLNGRFSLVIDGGSLEHVFNFPQAILNCMDMLSVGGHYVAISPANNFMGHGFYQFSPELYYRVFCRENGFAMERMVIYQDCWPFAWHDVRDPEEVRQRVTLVNRYPTYLLVQSQKVDARRPFTPVPQQSDYVGLWNQPGRDPGAAPVTGDDRRPRGPASLLAQLRSGIGRLAPDFIKDRYRRLSQGADPFDPRFFQAVDRGTARDGPARLR